MNILNKIKGNLFRRKKKIQSISNLNSFIGKEVIFPTHYFCVVTKDNHSQNFKLSLKSSTINNLLLESKKKKALFYLPYYLNLNKTENYMNFKNMLQNTKNKNDIEDFYIVSYFTQSDINLFYNNISPILYNCNFTFLINEFDSVSIQKFFKGQYINIVLDEENKLISSTYTSKKKTAFRLAIWLFLIYFNFTYIPEVENFLKI